MSADAVGPVGLPPQQGRASESVRSLLERPAAPDRTAAAAAADRQDRLVKPRGALGVLEDVSVQLAGLAGSCPPPVPQRAVLAVFAADHGVHARGVSPWPQQVTAQMVATFLAGGAAANALAATVGAQVLVCDVGVATAVPAPAGTSAGTEAAGLGAGGTGAGGTARLLRRRVRAGTRDLSREPAMTLAEVEQALLVGAEVADRLVAEGAEVLLTGDMGIANTTASAALVAAFTGADPDRVTGRGTGIDPDTWRLKVDVVRGALDVHADVVASAAADPLAVLAALGGLEHAAIAGFVLAAAGHRVPVVLDGVIAGAAALAATALAPLAVHACIAGHRSVEPGHAVALDRLGLRPLIDLDLRLGEGTGALLALPVVRAAARALRDMATLDQLGSESGVTP